jgi:hypothetical protein
MRRFLLVGCNDHANFGRLHETMSAKLRPSLDFDVSLFFISKIWRVGWTPDFKRIAATCNLRWRQDVAAQIQRAPSEIRGSLISQLRQNPQTRVFDRHDAARFGPFCPTFVDPQMRLAVGGGWSPAHASRIGLHRLRATPWRGRFYWSPLRPFPSVIHEWRLHVPRPLPLLCRWQSGVRQLPGQAGSIAQRIRLFDRVRRKEDVYPVSRLPSTRFQQHV